MDSSVNLLAGVPLGSFDLVSLRRLTWNIFLIITQLRHDALKTLETLDQLSISGDPFAEVFLTDQRDLPARFDAILRY